MRSRRGRATSSSRTCGNKSSTRPNHNARPAVDAEIATNDFPLLPDPAPKCRAKGGQGSGGRPVAERYSERRMMMRSGSIVASTRRLPAQCSA